MFASGAAWGVTPGNRRELQRSSVPARRSGAGRRGRGSCLARRTVNPTTRGSRNARPRVRPCPIGGGALPKAGSRLFIATVRAGGVPSRRRAPRKRDYYRDAKRSRASHAAELRRHGQGPRRRSGASGTPTARSRIDSKTFKRSNDPGFIGKLEDVADFYCPFFGFKPPSSDGKRL